MAHHRFENAYEYWERTTKRHLPNQIWYDNHLFQINSRRKSETDHKWTGYYRCVDRPICKKTVKFGRYLMNIEAVLNNISVLKLLISLPKRLNTLIPVKIEQITDFFSNAIVSSCPLHLEQDLVRKYRSVLN